MAEVQAEVLAEEDRMAGRSGGTTQASKKEYKFAIQVHGSTTANATHTSVKEALIMAGVSWRYRIQDSCTGSMTENMTV